MPPSLPKELAARRIEVNVRHQVLCAFYGGGLHRPSLDAPANSRSAGRASDPGTTHQNQRTDRGTDMITVAYNRNGLKLASPSVVALVNEASGTRGGLRHRRIL